MGRTRKALRRFGLKTLPAWFAVALFTALGPASADTPPISAPARAASPSLTAAAYGPASHAAGPKALKIGRLDISVDLAGGVSKTTVVATFENPSAVALEGDFTLALPQGAVITGYALDVNGKMIDGVLTGKRQAELAYQRKVRRGLDPGLAEMTRDNAFETHVFPILPGKGRTVRLEFAAPLDPDRPYALPLFEIPDGVGDVDQGAAPQRAPSLPDLKSPTDLPLTWAPASDAPGMMQAEAAASGAVLSGALEIADRGQPVITVTRHHAGESFFEIADTVKDRASALRLVRIYWGASRSRRDDNLKAEQALVGRYLAAVKPETVDVVLFADGAPSVETFPRSRCRPGGDRRARWGELRRRDLLRARVHGRDGAGRRLPVFLQWPRHP